MISWPFDVVSSVPEYTEDESVERFCGRTCFAAATRGADLRYVMHQLRLHLRDSHVGKPVYDVLPVLPTQIAAFLAPTGDSWLAKFIRNAQPLPPVKFSVNPHDPGDLRVDWDEDAGNPNPP